MRCAGQEDKVRSQSRLFFGKVFPLRISIDFHVRLETGSVFKTRRLHSKFLVEAQLIEASALAQQLNEIAASAVPMVAERRNQ